jgi:pimeloyl-ACP methyl ester carboxylesterase
VTTVPAVGAQRLVPVGGDAQVCAEAIGAPDAPAILLIHGASASMDRWDDELCRLLADRGRLVVRYDHRDTGASTSYPPGEPGYTGADLVADAVAVLDGLGVERAHVVGISMGGALAQRLGIEHRDRVATLTLMSTTAIVSDGEDLPAMAPELREAFANPPPDPDWHDRAAVIDYIVATERPYSGPGDFDEERLRALAGRVFDRSRDMASAANHWTLDDPPMEGDLGDLAGLPTLVLHGSADPMFPPAHGRALADRIPGARFVELEGVGHETPPPRLWPVLVDEIVQHTAPGWAHAF